MKSVLFIAFLAIAAIGCDTPENTTGTDMSAPPADSSMSTGMDTTSSVPADTATMPSQPTDTTTMPQPTDSTTTP